MREIAFRLNFEPLPNEPRVGTRLKTGQAALEHLIESSNPSKYSRMYSVLREWAGRGQQAAKHRYEKYTYYPLHTMYDLLFGWL